MKKTTDNSNTLLPLGTGQTMTPEQLKEMIEWFSAEAEQLTKSIHKYNDAQDYYQAAKAEGMRDAYLRAIKKLQEE